MRVCGKGATLQGAEGSSPPLAYLTVDDDKGEQLIRLGLATRVSDDDEAPAASEEAPAETQTEEGSGEPIANAEEAPAPTAEEGSEAPAAPSEPEAPAPTEEPTIEHDRAALIADALDLVEEAGLETKGARKGKPTVAAIQAITDLNDVTADEIDAALAAREAA